MLNSVTIKIGNDQYQTEAGVIQGATLYALADIQPPQQLVVSRNAAIDVPVAADDYLIIEGGEKFTIGDGVPPIEDNPCLRKGITFSLNDTKFKGDDALDKPKLLALDLKKLASDYHPGDGLFAELKGFADEPIQDDWRLLIQDKDKFITTPCGNVGDDLALPANFTSHLEVARKSYDIDVVPNGPGNLLIVNDVKLPVNWLSKTVDIMVQTLPSYPAAAMDMFWVYPHLRLNNGAYPVNADTFEDYAGIKWQRFSWHYNARQWNPVLDSISSHIRFCLSRFSKLS